MKNNLIINDDIVDYSDKKDVKPKYFNLKIIDQLNKFNEVLRKTSFILLYFNILPLLQGIPLVLLILFDDDIWVYIGVVLTFDIKGC